MRVCKEFNLYNLWWDNVNWTIYVNREAVDTVRNLNLILWQIHNKYEYRYLYLFFYFIYICL